MTVQQMALACIAVVVAAWPQLRAMVKRRETESAVPSYGDSIASLAAVRTRLKATGCLADEQKKSIDVLTLALVEGSDV